MDTTGAPMAPFPSPPMKGENRLTSPCSQTLTFWLGTKSTTWKKWTPRWLQSSWRRSKETLEWLEDVETSEDFLELFDSMELLGDVLTDGTSSADEFVEEASALR